MSIFLLFGPMRMNLIFLTLSLAAEAGFSLREGGLSVMGCEGRWVLCVSGCQEGGCLYVFAFLKDAEISLFLSTGTCGT